MDALLKAAVANLHNGPKGVDMQELTTGARFRALISQHQPLDPTMELGYDPREAAKMDCFNAPPSLKAASARSGTMIKQLDNGQKWRVVSREDNPADFITTFIIVKVTGQDT